MNFYSLSQTSKIKTVIQDNGNRSIKKIGVQFNKSMNIITDLFSAKSLINEESIPLDEPESSLISVAFDIMNNDVVTLKPSHELNAKQRDKEKLISDLSILDLNESIDQNKNLMNYIDFQFDNIVSFLRVELFRYTGIKLKLFKDSRTPSININC